MAYVKNGDISIYYEVEGQGPPLVLHLYSRLPDITFFTLPGLNHGQAFQSSGLVLPHIKEFLAKVNNLE